MELEEVAGRVDRLAADVTGAAARLAHADPGSRAFAGDGPGALFAVGRDLHDQWSAALAAREREAAAHGARLAELGDRLRWAADGYRAAEDAAHRRHRPEVT
ncbi:MAG: hypothetical protein V7603_3414 [Micromonosporaceae bacterium]|jgi:hypothetical protein